MLHFSPSSLLRAGASVLTVLIFLPAILRQSAEAVSGIEVSSPSSLADSPQLSERILQVNRNIADRGLHDFPGSVEKLLTGYAYGEFYDWDLYFENVYLSYFGVSKFDFSNMTVFLNREKPDGFVSRTLVNPRPTQMFKPFLAQLAVLGSQQTGSYEWLRDENYAKLQKYLDRWFAFDADHNGLPTWNSSDASGMDNQLSRSGAFDSYFDEGVDLACYLYRELEAMAIISGKLGKTKEENAYREHAKKLATLINNVFWDDKDGFYYDRNEKTGKPIRVKSVAGFFPLWAGVATPERARRLVSEHLTNENEFWLSYPVASYAKTEPDFYEGTTKGECNWRGNTWIPANYMIFHGLMHYGYDRIARELAEKTYSMALDKNPVTREYYDSETGQGYGMNPFWGWSSLAYAMPLEYQLHYDPMDLNGKIKPILAEKLGIQFPAEGQRDSRGAVANADLRAGIHELDVAPVWSGHPVNFALLTHGDQQYVAYYAADRQMTVAQRTLGQRAWHYTTLRTSVGWDSHNYITMAFDRDGYLHVAGNMHVVPLIYFRSTRPGDASSLVRVPAMTGNNETRVTYPYFFYDPNGALLFQYRFGKSGAGDTYRDRYDEQTKTWKPVTDQPLFEGGSARNAYPIDPVYGPDGWYHQVWVWRESPMADSNHDLSYARSRDLSHWETAAGLPLKLPLTLDTPGLILDPVPQHGGLINGSQSIGFDSKGNLVIAYTKYDAKGITQLYFARWQDDKWNIQQASDWNYRWDFHGGGSIPMQVMIGSLKASDDGLSLIVHHAIYGTGIWQVDPKTMHLIGKPLPMPSEDKIGAEYAPPAGSPMIQHFVHDLGGSEAGGANYMLTWNTLDANRDQPRLDGAPPPSMLRLVVSQ